MNLDRRRIGSEVTIEFWDHGIIEKSKRKDPFLCRVRGMIVDVTDVKVVVAYWTVLRTDKPTRDSNREEIVIVKRCITRWGISEVLKWHELS